MYLGIDPGVSGAYAVIDEHQHRILETFKETSWINIYTVLSGNPIKLAFIEDVYIRGGEGSKSSKTFMMNFGQWMLILALLDIPHLLKSPQVWQKQIIGVVEKISTKDVTDKKVKDRMAREHKKKIKAKSVEYANRYWGNLNLKSTEDGKADALNMAVYAMKYHLNQF